MRLRVCVCVFYISHFSFHFLFRFTTPFFGARSSTRQSQCPPMTSSSGQSSLCCRCLCLCCCFFLRRASPPHLQLVLGIGCDHRMGRHDDVLLLFLRSLLGSRISFFFSYYGLCFLFVAIIGVDVVVVVVVCRFVWLFCLGNKSSQSLFCCRCRIAVCVAVVTDASLLRLVLTMFERIWPLFCLALVCGCCCSISVLCFMLSSLCVFCLLFEFDVSYLCLCVYVRKCVQWSSSRAAFIAFCFVVIVASSSPSWRAFSYLAALSMYVFVLFLLFYKLLPVSVVNVIANGPSAVFDNSLSLTGYTNTHTETVNFIASRSIDDLSYNLNFY